MPNDFLVTLNTYNMRVVDVSVNPVYGVGEQSGFRIIRDFHPLVFFYALGVFLLAIDLPLIARLFYLWPIPDVNGLFSESVAMWLDDLLLVHLLALILILI